ncbi:MAG: FAD-dependent oxidoreductase, partial [Haloplanus sp.]
DDRGIDSVEEIDPDEAGAMFPPIADAKRAFYDTEGARVDGQAFTDAVFTAAESHGLETLADEVTDVRVDGDSVVGVETADGGAIDASRVVVAGGAWSTDFEADLDVEVPVDPQRGQVAHLQVADAETSDWPIVKGFRHHYIVPWAGGRVVCGATREDGSGFDPRLTVDGVRTVLDEGLRVAPGLDDATLAELRVGLRPLSADGLPVLGAVPSLEGAFLATGHGPTGLTLGPYSGKLVAAAVRGDAGAIPERFHVARFDAD